MVTAAPNPAIGALTDRMPAIPASGELGTLARRGDGGDARLLQTQSGDWDIREQQKPPRQARLWD